MKPAPALLAEYHAGRISAYAWSISEVNIVGPPTAPTWYREMLDEGQGIPFELTTETGETLCSGRLIGRFAGNEPLTDFGIPIAGATGIRFPEAAKLAA